MNRPMTTPEGPSFTSFSGRRAVVTGGTNGIGAAIARRLTELGARVAILDKEASAAAADIVFVDLSDVDAVPAAARDALDLLGGVDILVNCAGISRPQALLDLDLGDYHRTMAVNLHSPVLMMRELGRCMRHAKYGRIVNVTSIHARLTEPGSLAYDVSKAGLEAASRTAAIEFADDGVLVNVVAPGFVSTRMSLVDGIDELQSAEFQSIYVAQGRLPLRRAAAPAEIAEVVTWLVSEQNSYTTGQTFTVDGGLSARF